MGAKKKSHGSSKAAVQKPGRASGKPSKSSKPGKPGKPSKGMLEAPARAKGLSRTSVGAKKVPGARPTEDAESRFTLDQMHDRLGAPDGTLERALRSVHPDESLRKEGAKVLSERIVAEGERLCSKALAHLESKEAHVLDAARRAGLTRAWLTTTVDSLVQLRGESERTGRLQRRTAGQQATSTTTLAATVARGRRLRRQALDRLQLAIQASPELLTAYQNCRRLPDSTDKLAPQLEALADLVAQTLSHDETSRTLADHQGLGPGDATELREVASDLRAVREARGTGNPIKQQELQSLLDVHDGFCLLLLGRILKSLRELASTTSTVQRPVLHLLQGYFDGYDRTNGDEAPVPTPTPTPAPI